jgi:hypothetical protein
MKELFEIPSNYQISTLCEPELFLLIRHAQIYGCNHLRFILNSERLETL